MMMASHRNNSLIYIHLRSNFYSAVTPAITRRTSLFLRSLSSFGVKKKLRRVCLFNVSLFTGDSHV